MRSSRVSEIAALGFKILESGVKISPRAYETVNSAEIVELALKVKELEAENARLRQQRETRRTRNWRLYWRSYQKSREKAPFGALVLYGAPRCVFPCIANRVPPDRNPQRCVVILLARLRR